MRTCLIVDESSVIRKVASRILFQLGFEAQSAANGAEAQALMETAGSFDLVVTASILPDMGADDFVRALRASTGGRQTVVLGSMVEANLGQMTRLKRAGANGFVYKPFDRASLSGWIDAYFQRAAA